MAAPSTLDNATRVNVGLMILILSATVGGAVYLTQLKESVLQIGRTLIDVRQALDRTTAQIATDGQERAIQRTMIESIDRRLQALERARENGK